MKVAKNILVLTQWSYKDPLIQAYTLPYVKIIARKLPAGSRIHLVTFEQNRYKMTGAEKKQAKQYLSSSNIELLDFSYSPFGLISILKWVGVFAVLLWKVFTNRIAFIHAWCTTAGSLGYVLSKASGRPLVIDSYEPHAEAMVENGTWSAKGMKFRILFYFEKKQSRHAMHIVSATEGMRDYARRKYHVEFKHFYVKPACTDFTEFNLEKKKNPVLLKQLNLADKIVCVYAGKFGGIYLTKEVFDFLKVAESHWGSRFRALVLSSHDPQIILQWSLASGFDLNKLIVRFVPYEQAADYMGLADFAITPVKPIPTKRYCTPIKDGEYWALGLPVVITENISDDSEIIEKNNAGAVIHSLDENGYKEAIHKINELLTNNPESLSKRINSLAHNYRSYAIAEKIYEKIYSSNS